MKRKITLLVLAAVCIFKANAQQLVLLQNFNSSASVLTGTGPWIRLNNSSPAGATSWFMGIAGIFPAYNGPDTTYFAANYNNTTGGSGTISNWLISPTVSIANGGVFKFATRTNTVGAGQAVSPDRLRLYMSTTTATTGITGPTGVGSFTNMLVTVNPSLTASGYPTAWTVYTATISNVTGTVSGRFAFRYDVPSAGPTGTNSSYVGIDGVSYTLPCSNPTVSASTSSAAICQGDAAVLTATGATTYTWSTGAVTPTIAVSPTATTVYTLIGSSTPGCNDTALVSINVTFTPNLSVANVTTCPGTAATLVATGASSYSWSTGATTNSIVDTPTTNTTYSVTAYNGMCEVTNTVSIELGSALSVNVSASQGTICAGSTLTLTTSQAGTYTWMPNNTHSMTAVVSPSTSTVYTITASSGTCSGTNSIAITVNPAPNVLITPNTYSSTCVNATINFTASGATSYTWNGSTPNTTVAAFTPTSAGSGTAGLVYTYSVVGTGTNGCTKMATATATVNLCTGIETIQASNSIVAVFPNPFGSELNVTGLPDAGSIEVYDALGQLVLKAGNTNNGSINTSNFAKGIYVLKAYNGDNKLMRTVKLIRN